MLLKDWLKEKDIARKDFAASIGVSPSYITALCAGTVWPGREVVEEIQRVTRGKVTANDFTGAAA